MGTVVSNVQVSNLLITAIYPDGSAHYIGCPGYLHPNPIVNLVRGSFERWNFARKLRAHNRFVESYNG